jgi:hypothetical protein
MAAGGHRQSDQLADDWPGLKVNGAARCRVNHRRRAARGFDLDDLQPTRNPARCHATAPGGAASSKMRRRVHQPLRRAERRCAAAARRGDRCPCQAQMHPRQRRGRRAARPTRHLGAATAACQASAERVSRVCRHMNRTRVSVRKGRDLGAKRSWGRAPASTGNEERDPCGRSPCGPGYPRAQAGCCVPCPGGQPGLRAAPTPVPVATPGRA